MVSVLVAYATSEGQTAKIAERIAAVIGSRGHDATAREVDADGDVDPTGYDAVVVGASIHYGRQQRAIRSFVTSHREFLETVPTAFFQVSLAGADPTGAEEAAGYLESFVDETGWHPDRIAQFGGALRFSEYGFLKRLLMKRIAKAQLPDVDRSVDAELTDWTAVEAFANDTAAFVEGRLGVVPTPEGTAETPEDEAR